MAILKHWPLVLLAVLPSALSSGGWAVQNRADPESRIKLHIGISTTTASELASRIADPRHAQFRNHLDVRDLQDVLRPDHQDVVEVERWLQSAGLVFSDYQLQGNVFQVSTITGIAETLLNTTYHEYTDGEKVVVRTASYRVLSKLKEKITFIAPTTSFPLSSKKHNVGPADQVDLKLRLHQRAASCGAGDNTTPSCIRQIYNITYTPQPNRTTFGIYATEAASYSASDLHKFLVANNPPAAEANASYEVIGSGDSANGSPGVTGAFETALDTQTALGLVWPAHGILYNLGGVFGPKVGEMYDPFVQFLQDLIHNETVPSVVSFSESTPEDQIDPAYARSLCEMMMHVGMRGVTLLFSSGDNGPDGDQPTGTHKAIFEPEFPASCPWVTAVGGTTDLANETAATQQTLTSAIDKLSYTASGGGFSNLFNRPSYQSAAVGDYIAHHVPASYYAKSGFNASGAGIPDVSAFSTNFPVVWNGLTIPIGGTSASTPLWAAVITLLNDYEASKGRPSLGFVNPWLYSLRDGFKDITTGGNSKGGCILLSGCTLSETDGYDVVRGWDPVTGLGSPVFDALTRSLDALASGAPC